MSANVTSHAIMTGLESGEKNIILYIENDYTTLYLVVRTEYFIEINVNSMQLIVNLELISLQVKFPNVRIRSLRNQNPRDFQKLKAQKAK